MAILKIKDADGNFISVPTITGMPKGIYMGVTEPVDLETILWIDTSEPTEPTEPAPVLITFSIGDVACTVEDGMTWAQWVESDYNTPGCQLSNNGGVDFVNEDVGATASIMLNGGYISSSDTIIADTTYTLDMFVPY